MQIAVVAGELQALDIGIERVDMRDVLAEAAESLSGPLDKAEARLYVVNGLSDDMTVIDVAAAKALKTIPVGRVPYQAVVVE